MVCSVLQKALKDLDYQDLENRLLFNVKAHVCFATGLKQPYIYCNFTMRQRPHPGSLNFFQNNLLTCPCYNRHILWWQRPAVKCESVRVNYSPCSSHSPQAATVNTVDMLWICRLCDSYKKDKKLLLFNLSGSLFFQAAIVEISKICRCPLSSVKKKKSNRQIHHTRTFFVVFVSMYACVGVCSCMAAAC